MATTCYPAVPGEPSIEPSATVIANLGWNAGAVSANSVAGDLSAEFEIGASTLGALVGLAPPGAATGAYGAITHGFLYADDALAVVESAVEVVDTGVVLTPGMRLRITRVGGVVTYHADDWQYTSAQASYGDTILAAVLYAAGDYVTNPVLTGLRSMGADAPWGWADDFSRRALRASAPWGWGGDAALVDGRVTVGFDMAFAASDVAMGSATIDVGGVEIDAVGGFPDVEIAGLATLVPYAVAGVGSSVYSGSGTDSMDMAVLGADYDYGLGGGEVADLICWGNDPGEAPGTGSYFDVAYLTDTYSTDAVLYAMLRETLTIDATLDVLIAIDAMLLDRLVALDAHSAAGVFTALLTSGLTFSDDASLVSGALSQYATNVATGAVTRYAGFDFRGFCTVGLTTYGWRKDGLYRLGADDDDGEPIDASVDFAAEAFGIRQQKRLDAVYFGVDTDGTMYARLTDDDDVERTYNVLPRGSEARATPARGLSSRYWRLQLQIIGATTATLDHIEWVAAATRQRTTRGRS